MKIRILLITLVASFSLASMSCELVTEDPPVPKLKPANHLVINEIFTLPVTHQRTFSWIEFYNPTGATVNTRGWTFSFTTNVFLTTYAIDDTFAIIPTSFRSYQFPEGAYEIPLPRLSIRSGEFLTATNNDDRLTTYTDYGQGGGEVLKLSPNWTFQIDTVVTPPGTPDTVRIFTAFFHFRTTDQLVLKDSSGNVVDVVRYGNYVYPGPGADPFPTNRSIGVIPEFQSVARYFGAYWTGNTVDDFYITWPNDTNLPGGAVAWTRPIPHWLSQAYKQ